MIATLPDFVLVNALIFCRIGTALMLVPGLSNARFPALVRLLFAIAATLALSPLLAGALGTLNGLPESAALWPAVMTEAATGLAFGFWCYLFLHASRLAASKIASSIGLAGIPGQPIEDHDPNSTLATFLTLSSTAVIIATDLHLLGLRALAETYAVFPFNSPLSASWLAENSVKLLRETTVLALQVAAPFIVLAVVVNLALGLCSKFTPQLQIYFASLGLTIIFSLVILALMSPAMLRIPASAYEYWLENSLR